MPTATLDPDALLARIAARDRDALGALFDRFAVAVFALAGSILSDRDEAEDVQQEVFVQVWREAASFDRTRGSVPAWVMAIARHRSIDRLRARRRRELAHLDHDARESEAPPGADEHVARLSDADRVHRALHVLNESQRQALQMSYFAGRSHTEIAAAIGVPVGTVKSRIAKALQTLRVELGSRVMDV